MTWTGWNDLEFNLLDPTLSGVMLVQDGVRGLSMPAFDRYTSQAPGVPGARWRGFSTDEREVFWPTLVWTDSGTLRWHELDSAWWSTMRPDALGTWDVTTVTGTRRLRLRFEDDGDHSYPADPMRRGWSLYGIKLVAEQPYWEGDPVTYTWEQAAGAPFLPGPPFYVSGSVSLESARMSNDGDVDAYPTWELTGPFSSATVGWSGAKIDVPFPVAAGDALTIDTRPDMQTATLTDGTDRTGDLGTSAFAPIPAGGDRNLTLSVAGAGSVTASMTPLYFRAWGSAGGYDTARVASWWAASNA